MASEAVYRYDAQARHLTLTIHVQPGAKSSAVVGRHGDALKIRLAAPAVEGKANAALIRFLHQWLAMPAANISIRSSTRGRRKIVEIANAGPGLENVLKEHIRESQSPDRR